MKGPKPPKIVVVLIVTTITIIFWVFLSVYEVLRKTPDLNIPDAVLKPLTPSLDQTSLGELPARVFYSEEELKNINTELLDLETAKAIIGLAGADFTNLGNLLKEFREKEQSYKLEFAYIDSQEKWKDKKDEEPEESEEE